MPPVHLVRRLALFRAYPELGQFASDTSVSDCANRNPATGAQVADKGYCDDKYLPGFRRGWYGDKYWRVVGNGRNIFLSGGIDGVPKKFRVTNDLNLGSGNARAMVWLPDEGFVFCRGVDNDSNNPELAVYSSMLTAACARRTRSAATWATGTISLSKRLVCMYEVSFRLSSRLHSSGTEQSSYP